MPHVYLKQQVKRCENTSPYNRNLTMEGIQSLHCNIVVINCNFMLKLLQYCNYIIIVTQIKLMLLLLLLLNALELIAIEIGASLEILFVSLSVAFDSHDNFIFTLKLKGCLSSGELQCTPHQICHSSRYPIYNVTCITPISKKYGG